MIRRTFVGDGSSLGIEGQILITVYEDRATIAVRENGQRTWGVPLVVRETTWEN